MAVGQTEVQQLYRSLEGLVGRALETESDLGEAERLEIYRLLHSIKSWAGFEQLTVLEAACHGLEDLVRQQQGLKHHELLDLAAGLIVIGGELRGRPGLGNGLNQTSPAAVSNHSGNLVWKLSAPHPAFSDRELRLLQSLRSEGRAIRCCRVWISPDEPLPLTRILVLHTRFESLGLVRAELWLAKDGLTQGPFSPQEWLGGAKQDQDWEGQGGWYRCYYGQVADASDMGFDLDQTESLIDSELGGPSWVTGDFQACPINLIDLNRLQMTVQGMVAGNHDQTSPQTGAALLSDLVAVGVSGWLGSAMARWQPLAGDLAPNGVAIRWQLFDEGQRLPGFALSVLDEISRQLLRNSLVHGLEGPDQRLAAGKAESLRIGISFVEAGPSIRYHYEDDGCGLDLSRLAAIAKTDPAELADPARLLALICQAEFSSADPLGRHAGRGMGLNLVAQLAGPVLGGQLSLTNKPGQGLGFSIDFPRDLVELAVHLFKTADGLWAIPQVRIGAIVARDSRNIVRDRHGQAFLSYAGQQIPVWHERAEKSPMDRLLIVLCQDGQLTGALGCERYLGGEKVLVGTTPSQVYSRIARDWTRLWLGQSPGIGAGIGAAR